MSSEIEQAIDDLVVAAKDYGVARFLTDENSQHETPEERDLAASRARLLALLAPEPSDAEIEAGAKALEEWERSNRVSLDDLFSDDRATEQAMRAMRHAEQCQQAKAVLLAARAARQMGGA